MACEIGALWSVRRRERGALSAERTNDPTKVDISGEVGSKSDRCKLSGIGDGEGLEDAEAVFV